MFQAEDGIRCYDVTGVQTCALPIWLDDYAGKIALDYGIYGVPETFFIDPEGTIFYKHIGAVTDELLEKKFKPFL